MDGIDRRTPAQRAGSAAERLVADRLTALGWRVLARNVHVGRSELDLVAVDPGPPGRTVVVEVRWRRRTDHGLPEETFDHRKRARLRAGVARLVDGGELPDGARLPRLTLAVDLVVVEPGAPGQPPRIRHFRDVLEHT